MARIKIILVILLCFILTILLYSQKEKLSVGNRYYHTLQLWYQLAQDRNWDDADKVAMLLDPLDTLYYRTYNHPGELKKVVNSLVIAPKKSVEDWLELARVQAILGKNQESMDSLSKAHDIDPIRDDITTLYYQTKR